MMSQPVTDEVFIFESKNKGGTARGVLKGERITVLKGSTIARRTARSMPARYQKLRRELIEGKLITANEYGDLTFIEDYTFANPSEAANVIQGGSRNGYDWWKDAAGKSLKERGLVGN